MKIFGTYKDVIKNSKRANAAFVGLMASSVGVIAAGNLPSLLAVATATPLFVIAMNVYKQQNDSYKIAKKICEADKKNGMYWLNAIDKCPVEVLSSIDCTLKNAKTLFKELETYYDVNDDITEVAINACFGYQLIQSNISKRSNYLSVYPEAIGFMHRYESFDMLEYVSKNLLSFDMRILTEYSKVESECRWLEYFNFIKNNGDLKILELLLNTGCSEKTLRSQLKNTNIHNAFDESPMTLNF